MESHLSFTVRLKGVAIDHEEVEGATACVQNFVCNPLFTQRILISETGIGMLNTSFASADAVQHSSEFNPWRAIVVETVPVIADLKACCEKALLRKKAVEVMRERWFGADRIASSVVGEAAPSTSVCISDAMEIGDAHSFDVHHKFGLLSCSRSVSSPVEGKKEAGTS